MGYSLPANLQQPSAAYDWVSKMLYVAGRMQMRNSSQFVILRKSVVTGSQEMFTRFFTSSGIQGRTVQITVNPFSRYVHVCVCATCNTQKDRFRLSTTYENRHSKYIHRHNNGCGDGVM